MESLIDKVRKSDSFQVPDGYFDTLPNQVMHRIETAEKVEQVLEKYREGKSFSAPAGYFEALPDQVMGRIQADAGRRSLFRRRLITTISVAASLALLVGIGLLWNNTPNGTVPADNLVDSKNQAQIEIPASAQSNLPENTLAQAVENEAVSQETPIKRNSTQSKDDLLEKKADDFIEKYADEDLDVIDYDILDYFSEEDYINFFLES